MALTMKDALRLAAKDPHFANELVTNPAGLKDQFGLTDQQVDQLKNLGTAAATAKANLSGQGPTPDYD